MLDEYVNKIESEFKENDSLIKKCKAKIHELNLYNLEDRVGRITILSTLLYMPVFFGLFFLEIPGAIFPGATLFTSFGLGNIGNLLAEKKAKCKERFKKISKSKNEKERLEEILKLEMEIERLQIRNEIINRVKSKHNSEINMINKFSKNQRYTLEIKKSNYTRDELINKINELEKSLKIKYELLDKLSYQSVIKDKKNSLKDKMTPLFQSMMCAFVPMLLSIMPVFACIVARPLPAPSMIPLYTTFAPAILAFVGAITHFSLKKKNTIKAIKSITKESNNKECRNVYSELDKLKSDITNILYSLNSYKNEYENYDLIEEYNRKKDKSHTIKDEEKLNLDGPNLLLK